jgi:hypothetical protein
MTLLNIVHNTPLVNHEKVDYVNYIETDDPVAIRNALKPAPILLIGYKLAKNLYQKYQEVNILDKQLTNGVLWEFSYDENRSQHIEGVFNIVHKRILNVKFSTIKYELIDPIFNNIRKEEEILSKILPVDFSYITSGMIYAYNSNAKAIYGIDLKAYNFFGFNEMIIRDTIASFPHQIDLQDDILVDYKLKFPYVNNLKRYLVLLLQTHSK